MTMPPRGDDDLREMLDALAGRMPRSIAREVLDAVRSEVRGPAGESREGVTYGVLPLDPVRHSGARWRLALLGVAVVVAVAVLGSRLDLGGPGPAPALGGPSPAGTPVPAETPRPIASARAGLAYDDLRRALDGGSLDGRVIVVTGRLQLLVGRCLAGTTGDCTWLRLVGFDDVTIDKGALSVDEATAAVEAHPGDAPIALRVTDGSLAFLGWLAAGVPAALDVAGLARSTDVGPVDLAVVDGWAMGPGRVAPSCPSPAAAAPSGPSSCPGARARLTGSEPGPDGAVFEGAFGLDVALEPAVGLGPAPGWVAGPFLVGGADISLGGAPAYRIVDRLDPATTVWVDQAGTASVSPAPTAASAPLAGSISADELRVALADGSLDGRVLTVQGTLTMAGDCGYGSGVCTIFGLEGLAGVPVTWDGPLMLPAAGETERPPVTVSGRLVLVPRAGGLVLLGRLKGALERPHTVGELVSNLLSFDPFVVQAVTGWLVRPRDATCPSDAPQPLACEATRTFLTDREPVGMTAAPGGARMNVAAGSGPGLAGDATVVGGQFLGRFAFDGACTRSVADVLDCSTLLWTWTVVARYDHAEVLSLATP